MMKNLEYYVPSAELGKEFSQIVGIIVSIAQLYTESSTCFMWWKLLRVGKGHRGEVPTRLTDGGNCV
jgi:hypothetical protein